MGLLSIIYVSTFLWMRLKRAYKVLFTQHKHLHDTKKKEEKSLRTTLQILPCSIFSLLHLLLCCSLSNIRQAKKKEKENRKIVVKCEKQKVHEENNKFSIIQVYFRHVFFMLPDSRRLNFVFPTFCCSRFYGLLKNIIWRGFRLRYT